MSPRLNINIDHVATVREARRAIEPSVVAAACICEQAGADGITVHLRSDRRHIHDRDLFILREAVTTYLNVEMAATNEMMGIALKTLPDCVTLVSENPHEITTERGLNIVENFEAVGRAIAHFHEAGIISSVFIDPEPAQIEAARQVEAAHVELSTARYAEATLGRQAFHPEGREQTARELERLRAAAEHAARLGVRVAAGHGLTAHNVGAVAAIPHITEFNIGHSIIAGAIFKGLDASVREMIDAIHRGHAAAK